MTGQLIAVDLKAGKIFKDKDIKDYLAKDFTKFHKQVVHFDKKLSSKNEFPNFQNEDLKRQFISGRYRGFRAYPSSYGRGSKRSYRLNGRRYTSCCIIKSLQTNHTLF